jgi:excisionase family DNA binding protein
VGNKQKQVVPLPPFWSHAETAHYLGIPEATLRQWLYKGSGPRSYKIGRHRKFRPEDVETWLEGQADQPPPAT